jgi:hypothetical protein
MWFTNMDVVYGNSLYLFGHFKELQFVQGLVYYVAILTTLLKCLRVNPPNFVSFPFIQIKIIMKCMYDILLNTS